MAEALEREFVYLWYYFDVQLNQIAGYWALGVVIGSLVSVFEKEQINKLFASLGDNKLGALGVIPASALGIASPLCMYGTIPIAASFSAMGIGDDMLAAFMMSSVLLNPQLIAYSAALGPVALAVRVVSCFICGVAAGLCVRVFFRGKGFFSFDGFAPPENRDRDPSAFLRLMKNIGRNVKVTGPYFLLGVALSALFQRYVPESVAVRLFGGSHAWGGPDGGDDRSAALRLRRRHHPSSPRLAGGRHEPRFGRGVHDHRPRDENHQPQRGKDRSRPPPLRAVYPILRRVFIRLRTNRGHDLVGALMLLPLRVVNF